MIGTEVLWAREMSLAAAIGAAIGGMIPKSTSSTIHGVDASEAGQRMATSALRSKGGETGPIRLDLIFFHQEVFKAFDHPL